MNNCFENAKKNFGFGCMRLPMKDEQVDYDHFNKMIDAFMDNGFNYFDTAHGYIDGKSETAIRDCLVARYPRESFVLVNKLSDFMFKKNEDIRPALEDQLKACGVDYFDIYLMHAQNTNNYNQYIECKAYETAFELKKEGKVRHVGLSFHDKAEFLDKILTDYPEIETVQIQFNYADYDDESVEGKKCYEVCRKHGKPIIVMEPVKGGSLVNLPEPAKRVLNELNGGSPASYAIRFAAGFEGIAMVLSGMSNMEQLEDNISYMKNFVPLNDAENNAIKKVCEIFKSQDLIPCTACRYCIDGCPMHIAIPDLFSCLNGKKLFQNWNTEYYYDIHTSNGRKASDCIKCGKCETSCPQHLEIRNLLDAVAAEFEKVN